MGRKLDNSKKNNQKNNKKVMIISVLILVIVIISFNFYNNYSILKQPPSKEWSKEVEIGIGTANDRPVLIKEENRLLLAYEDVGKVIINEMDLLGNITKKLEINTNSDFVKNLMFVKAKDGYKVLFKYGNISDATVRVVELDKDINEVRREDLKDIKQVYQVDSETIVIGSNNQIKVVNEIQNIDTVIPIENLTEIMGTKAGDKIIVGYVENKFNFKSVVLENGQVVSEMDIVKLSAIDKLTYSNFTVSADPEKVYFLYDEYVKGEYSVTKAIELNLNTKEIVEDKLAVNGNGYIVNPRGVISTDGGRFYATIERPFGYKDYQKDIVGFTIKDGEVGNVEYVSRLRELCILAYADEDYLTFLSFEDGKYMVNLCSQNQDFMDEHNGFNKKDVTNSALFTFQGIMMSIAYIIVFGFRWILPSLFIAGIISFFDYNFSKKKKYIMYIALSILTVVFKFSAIYSSVYKLNGAILPPIVASPIVGMVLCALVSLIIFTSGYFIYKDDVDVIFVAHFGLDLVIDALLTCLIFVPLIV